ncbi:MAG: hypothetical protein AAB300_01895 [Nitrospirota bacterium]
MKNIAPPVFLFVMSLGLTACGGSSPTTPSSTSVETAVQKPGFSLPATISAVPTTASGSAKPTLLSKLSALSGPMDVGTDYAKTATVRYVSEHELEHFDIIGDILSALAQTHYADLENINQGPYLAMVSFQEEQDGRNVKNVEPWVVDSKMVVRDNQEINRIQIWLKENDDGMSVLIKAQFEIFAPASQKPDGSFSNYGVWTVNASMEGAGDRGGTFSADIGVDPLGATVIKINENFSGGGMRSIINRTDTAGFGKIQFPDFRSCQQDPCTPPLVTTAYAYNGSHLGLKRGNDVPIFKDRNIITDLVGHYGLFNGTTGEDVLRTKSFGFPVEYITTSGEKKHAFYGAWQGRHQLWAQGDPIPNGTEVVHQDFMPNAAPGQDVYTVAEFLGVLTLKDLTPGNLADIQNIPVESFDNMKGRIYIEYKGTTGWVEKTMTSFDKETWTPTFDNAADKPYSMEVGREYYIHALGVNFIVGKDANGVYTVQKEAHETVHPANAATHVPNGTVFQYSWAGPGSSTFKFITDINDSRFLKLVYETVGSDAMAGATVGGIVTRGIWGLVSTTTQTTLLADWQYPPPGEHWGNQTFLVKNGQYKILDSPIALKPIVLASKTLSLQYDGWMHGLPDLFRELARNNFQITQEMADKIITIPPGTVVEDADVPGTTYLVKPLDIQEFMKPIPNPGTLNLAQADSVNLATVPVFVNHGMGPIPTNLVLKYIEGQKIQ